MSQYYSISKFSKIVGVTPQTLRNWDKSGRLHPHHTSANGYRWYSEEQLNKVLNIQPNTKRITVGYCRVSSKKQTDNLNRQIVNMQTYLNAQGQPYKIITDIGSGIDYNKKGLQDLIKLIIQGRVSKIVVLYKDRLVRFGYELIEYIASLYDCKIEIIDNSNLTSQEELVKDLIQTITVFSCKLQDQRSKQTKRMIQELSKKEGMKHVEKHENTARPEQ